MDDKNYVPPFRLGHTAGSSGRADARGPRQSRGGRYNNGRGYRGQASRGQGSRGQGSRGGQGREQLQQILADRPHIDESELRHAKEIYRYFWGADDAAYHDTSTTFHSSKDHPDDLAYVFLFFDSNPRWPNDRILFAKSRLTLLPEFVVKRSERQDWPEKKNGAGVQGDSASDKSAQDVPPGAQEPKAAPAAPASRAKYTDIRKDEGKATPTPTTLEEAMNVRITPASQYYREPSFPAIEPIDYVPVSGKPIAVFEEQYKYIRGNGIGGSRFAFTGWFIVTRISVLAPNSAELLRMMHQKWERKDRLGNIISSRPRDPAAWNSSLAAEWAVVKFEPLSVDDAPPPPAIEIMPPPSRPAAETRSVNEILAELRLGEKPKAEEETQAAKPGDDGADTPGQD